MSGSTRSLVPRTPGLTEQRPADAGPIRWTLAAATSQISAARGLPSSLHTELTQLLDGWYGAVATELARAIGLAVTALLNAGGAGSLRLAATSTHVLVELTHRQPPPAAQATTSGAADVVDDSGHYQTLGETSSCYVSWARLVLPAPLVGRNKVAAVPEADDVWS